MRSTLQQLSLYLAGHTGFGADTCYYGVLVLVAGFVAVLVVGAGLALQRGVPMGFEEAQRQGRAPGLLIWAVQNASGYQDMFDFFI